MGRLIAGFVRDSSQGLRKKQLPECPSDGGNAETSLGTIPFQICAEQSIGTERPLGTRAVAALLFSVKEAEEETLP